MTLAVALALCCTALAQDDGGGDGKKKGGGGRAPKYRSLLRSCPVLMRIAFTDEQKTKVTELEGEVQADFDKAVADAGDDRAKLKEVRAKVVELHTGLREKIVALLDEEQKKKYDAGMTLVADYKTKIGEAMKAKERDKAKELKAEQETKLNEVVGPRAGGGKPKRPPKKKKEADEGGGDPGGGDQNPPEF
jgi:hypothetical protein